MMMKSITKLGISIFFLAFLAMTASAQNYSYEYNDDVFVSADNNTSQNSRVVDVQRNQKHVSKKVQSQKRTRIQNQRSRKAELMDRAYSVALADGRINRREKSKLRQMENQYGIYRLDRKGRRVCR